MSSQKRRPVRRGAADTESKKDARAGGETHLVEGHARAVMPRQPTAGGRVNACWVPPIVAAARFYGCTHLRSGAELGVDSVLELCPGDEDESADELLWGEFEIGCWTDDPCWGQTDNCQAPMFNTQAGWEEVSERWVEDLKQCITGGNVALMLVERCEEGEAKKHAKSGGKDKKCADLSRPTHYLLILGYQVENGRRGRKAYTLLVKDPMEEDELLTARLEANAGGRIELRTTQPNGTSALDCFRPLEACHFRGRRNVTAGMTSDEEAEEEATNLNAVTESSLGTKHAASAVEIHAIGPNETMQIREQCLRYFSYAFCFRKGGAPETDSAIDHAAFVPSLFKASHLVVRMLKTYAGHIDIFIIAFLFWSGSPDKSTRSFNTCLEIAEKTTTMPEDTVKELFGDALDVPFYQRISATSGDIWRLKNANKAEGFIPKAKHMPRGAKSAAGHQVGPQHNSSEKVQFHKPIGEVIPVRKHPMCAGKEHRH
ncbi:hypothetical protein CYMTET_16720 [Cymbomonas tetramitiformis]|uniref:Uncharacterized protein n=1 Tax=Cymbomonas tetramitiformis TaxID=36881 RepID=A0AAE0L7V3_9CHLO|nr:hypothetical protein CYMTET_16720 [Cymbomonas tetramitiformis]